ncbi:Uncharacterized protein DAT39_013963, partial [Clarias magur]
MCNLNNLSLEVYGDVKKKKKTRKEVEELLPPDNLCLSLQTNRGEQRRLEALWLDRTLIHPARLNPRSSYQRP